MGGECARRGAQAVEALRGCAGERAARRAELARERTALARRRAALLVSTSD